MSRTIAVSLAVAVFLLTTDAEAQKFYHRRQNVMAVPTSPGPTSVAASSPAMYVAQPAQTATFSTTPASTYSAPIASNPPTIGQPAPSRVYHYSYYVPPAPARTYVGYGAEDFPFHGVPYGHPYDPWTWPYMTSAYRGGLARYYDPPVK